MIVSGQVRRGRKAADTPSVCEGCGHDFIASEFQVRIGKARFCSRSCAGKANAAKVPPGTFAGERNPRFKNWSSRNKSAYTKKYNEKYPHKYAARLALKEALRTGQLVRPLVCEQCARTSHQALHGHHDDYTQPLVVRWLCRPCHLSLHWARYYEAQSWEAAS